MNMFARFNENQAMTLQDIKETKRYGRTDTRTDARTDNVKTVYPLQTKFAGGIIIHVCTWSMKWKVWDQWSVCWFQRFIELGLLYAEPSENVNNTADNSL